MSVTLTNAILPVFKMGLISLAHCLDKAAKNAGQRSFDPDVFVSMRLAPDMQTFASQVRNACDFAKNSTARVSGVEAPKFVDDETTFLQLQQRIKKTLVWLDTIRLDAFDGREMQEVIFPISGGATRTMLAEEYLRLHALPNFFFHVVTTYNLLRQSGVDLGKKDYLMGAVYQVARN